MSPPQSHILISSNRSPGCWCLHAPSIPLQPKHKDPFSWRSRWTEKLLHLKSLLNGFVHFPLLTLKVFPALSIPHKCPVSLCKQHLVLKKKLSTLLIIIIPRRIVHVLHLWTENTVEPWVTQHSPKPKHGQADENSGTVPGMNLCSTSTIHRGVLSIQDAKRTTVYERVMASGFHSWTHIARPVWEPLISCCSTEIKNLNGRTNIKYKSKQVEAARKSIIQTFI